MSDGSPSSDVRRLIDQLRPERRQLGALTALLVVAMLVPLWGPVLLGRFVDEVLGAADTATLVALALGFLAASVFGDGLQLVVTWLSARVAWRIGNGLRSQLCRHALTLDLDWHADHSAGQLIERIDGDIDAVTRFASTAVLQLLGNCILVIGVLVIAAFIDIRASLLIAATVAVALVVMGIMRRLATPFYDHEREVQSRLYGDVEERLGGLEDLRANGAGDWAVHRLHEHSSRWWHAARRAAIRGDGSIGVAGAVFAGGTVLMLGLGSWLALRGQMSVGTVLTLVRFSQMVADPLWQVAEQLSEAQKAVAGVQRAGRLLNTEATITDGRGPALPSGALDLDFDQVTFGYGMDSPVLHEVSLTIPAGTTVGVVGRTGSGKTSLGRLLARLWDTESGTVRVGGTDVRDLALADLRGRVAVVTQEVELFRASLRDNLTIFGTVDASDASLRAALADVGLGDWFAALPQGLDEPLRGGSELSAGEAQLLAFARLFLTDPGVVVLDEPSSRLDPATEDRLTAAVDRVLAGRTAVIIAHRLDTLARVDAICVLEHGRIVEFGPRAQLAADPTSRFATMLEAARGSGTLRSDLSADIEGRTEEVPS